MSTGKCDVRGSPRIFKAAHMLFTNPSMEVNDAMKLAGYSKRDLTSRRIRKSISKKKCRLQQQSEVNGKKKGSKPVSIVSLSTKRSSLSDITNSSESKQNGSSSGGTTTSTVSTSRKTSSKKTSPVSGRTKIQPRKNAFSKVLLAKNSRRTPNQVKAADIQRNEAISMLQSAYKWAVSEAKNFSNKVELAKIASEKFKVTVVPQTLRKLIREGRDQIMPSGPKPAIDDEEFKTISAAFCSYVALGQVNGESEKKRTDLLCVLDNLLKGKKIYDSKTLFAKLRKNNASLLDLSKEEVVEMRRLIWTTFSNLSDWYDAWEKFLTTQGFASEIINESGAKEIVFSEEQKRRIINIDETNLSLDGSDGGRGGRPSCTITIKHCSRPGTAQNKTSVSSSLMCGSNAAGEAMPLHIMFSSDASNEENYAVNAAWILALPRVTGIFGHDKEKSFPASVTTNEKGGTDGRVLRQLLMYYVNTLYPDAADIAGKRVLFKIDGGPGRLDIPMLAQLRSLGVYLFPGVQNTTHVTQETDQNYGEFKSLLRKHIQVLLNEMFAKYQEQQHDRANTNAPSAPPTLNRSHYGLLLSGRPADEENGVAAIPPIYQHCFSKEKNLRSWAACGAVPCTRQALNHRSVRHEVISPENTEDESNYTAVLVDYRNDSFDWASKTMKELEALNHASCQWLSEKGYNGKALKAKANVRPNSLQNTRIAQASTMEERVKAIVASGISLSSLFYTIGPSCLSVDEIFVAFEYREMMKSFEAEKKEYAKVLKVKAVQDKAKEILALNKATYNKSEILSILRWKLGEEFNNHKDKRISELQQLLCQHANTTPDDILLPPAPEQPSIPTIDQTEVGRARLRQFQSMLQGSSNYDNNQLQQLANELLRLCVERGVNVNTV